MLFLILAAVVWGSSFPVITYALRDVSPVLFLLLRFSLAFLLLLPRYRKLDRLKTLFRRDLILISIPNTLAFVLQYKAQELTTASKTAVFINSSPLFVALFSVILLGDRFTFRQLAAMVIALSGVVVTSTSLDFSSFSLINLGDLLCLGVGFSWAFFIIYSKGMARKHGAYNVSQALYFWGAMMTLPLLGLEDVRFVWTSVPAIVYLALFTTILAFYFYLKGVQSVTPLSTSIIILVEIVVAFLISHFFLGESFTAIETMGVVMVLVGVIVVLKR
ncbi:MAG: EamA family transporter [Candidatus Latescibacterota bacterium]|nr:MAG: EamA family transporter [Candidatus Latescibacterota bacterium]